MIKVIESAKACFSSCAENNTQTKDNQELETKKMKRNLFWKENGMQESPMEIKSMGS